MSKKVEFQETLESERRHLREKDGQHSPQLSIMRDSPIPDDQSRRASRDMNGSNRYGEDSVPARQTVRKSSTNANQLSQVSNKFASSQSNSMAAENKDITSLDDLQSAKVQPKNIRAKSHRNMNVPSLGENIEQPNLRQQRGGRRAASSKTMIGSQSRKPHSRNIRSIRGTVTNLDNTNSKSSSEIQYMHHIYNQYVKDVDKDKMDRKSTKAITDLGRRYYHVMRVKMARKPSPEAETPPEFEKDIDHIQKQIFIPPKERLRNIVVGEKPDLERVQEYKDKRPCLNFRKSIWKIQKYFSLICFNIISTKAFDYFILGVIIWNSVWLALNQENDTIDDIFLVIYTVEMALKIFGMGFYFGKGSYISENWNKLDFVIVVTAYIPKIIDSNSVNLQSLRVIRIARPLRTISNVESLKIIIMTLFNALGPLRYTLFILFFLFMIFAIGGLQLFTGLIKKRCMYLETGKVVSDENETSNFEQKFCNIDSDCAEDDVGAQFCGKTSANADYGLTNFDTIGYAFLMVFQTVTLEGWSIIMQNVQRTFHPAVALYFIFLVFMGAFFLLNLTLAVIKAEFDKSKGQEKSTKKGKKKARQTWTHDEKLVKKLSDLKLDIVDLLRKRKEGQTKFTRYEIKGKNLIADTRKSWIRSLGITSSIGRSKKSSNNQSRFMAALSKLKNSFASKSALKKSSEHSMKDMKNQSASDSSLINPRRGDNRLLSVIKQAQAQTKEKEGAAGQNNSTSSPMTSPKGDEKINLKQGLEPTKKQSSGDKPTGRDSPLFKPFKKESDHILADAKPQNGGLLNKGLKKDTSNGQMSTIDASTTSLKDALKNTLPNKGAGEVQNKFSIKVSEPNTQRGNNENDEIPGKSDKKAPEKGLLSPKSNYGINSNLAHKSPGSSSPKGNGAQSPKDSNRSPLPSSVFEESESSKMESVQTIPSAVFVSPKTTNNPLLSIRAFQNRDGKNIQGPVRASMKNRMSLLDNSPFQSNILNQIKNANRQSVLKPRQPEIVDIAGIRNKEEEKKKRIWQGVGDLLGIGAFKKQSDDKQNIEDDDSFFNLVKAQAEEQQPSGSKTNLDSDRARQKYNPLAIKNNFLKPGANGHHGAKNHENDHHSKLLKSLNKVKKVRLNTNTPSHTHTPHKESQFTSFDLDGDSENENNTANNVGTLAILDDDDFFEKNTLADKAFHNQRRHKRGKTRVGTKVMSRKHAREKSQKIKDIKEEEKFMEEQKMAMDDEEYESEEEEQERFLIDLRLFKLEALHQDYETDQIDDVMPSKKELEHARAEKEEFDRLRNTKIPLIYPITQKEKEHTFDRRQRSYRSSLGASTSLAMKKSIRMSQTLRSSRGGDDDDDEDGGVYYQRIAMQTMERGTLWEGSSGKQQTLRQSSTMRQRRGTRGGYLGGTNRVDDKAMAPEDMKDFDKVLEKIEEIDQDQEKWEEYEMNIVKEDEDYYKDIKDTLTKFKYENQFLNTRREDLKNKFIKNPWSGRSVLQYTHKDVAFDKVKRALNNQDGDIWRVGILGVIHAIRRKVKFLVNSNIFNNLIILCVLLNTIILAAEGLYDNEAIDNAFQQANFSFTVIFTVEMVLKIFGLGFNGYVSDKMNLFDAAIVIISLAEEIFLSGDGNNAVSAFRAVRLFRTFRVLRVTKLLRSLSYMRIIVKAIGEVADTIASIAVLLFLLIFIYSLLGMNFFGDQFGFREDMGVRRNFDDFPEAFMSVFVIMTQENWNTFLVLAYRSDVNIYLSVIYFVSWIFIGNYIFLNLFLAILLDKFGAQETVDELNKIDEDEEQEEEEKFKEVKNETQQMSRAQSSVERRSSPSFVRQKSLAAESNHRLEREMSMRRSTTELFWDSKDFDSDDDDDKKETPKINTIPCKKSFYVFSQTNPIRKACYNFYVHPAFDRIILGAIVLSSIKLAIDTYIPEDGNLADQISAGIDYFFNGLFILEAIIKTIALGFILDQKTYLRDNWNRLDFIIVVSSIFDMSLSGADLGFVKILRLLRTLRPLRFISHNVNLRLVVTALFSSATSLVNVVIVLIMIWLMFAILAINIVGDKMGRCDLDEYYGISYDECIAMGENWVVPDVNFDNVVVGMLSLFILSTQEGWPDIMNTVSDANDKIYGPERNENSTFSYIYFIIFIFVGSYFLLNLFVGVLFMEYAKAQDEENKLDEGLGLRIKQWKHMQRLILKKKPDLSQVEPPYNWQKKFFKITSSTQFDVFIISCILLNILTMAMTTETQSDEFAEVLKYINWSFALVFLIEMILKHLALGFKRYWSSGWNQFDAFVVLASIVDFFMDLFAQSLTNAVRVGPQLARVFRVLRVSRLLKLVKKFDGLLEILNTLSFSLPFLLNVGALLFLVYFIFSILGVFLFEDITKGTLITSKYNFTTFSEALVVLFVASTGENWQVIMFDTASPDECVDGGTSCTTPAIAYVFWIVYIVICQFIMLNLFILIILQQFEEYQLSDSSPVKEFNKKYDDDFRDVWEKQSKIHGGQKIHENQLIEFFSQIKPPLGFKGQNKMTQKQKAFEIANMKLETDEGGFVYFIDVLYATFRYGYERNDDNTKINELPESMKKEALKAKKKIYQIKKKQAALSRSMSVGSSSFFERRGGKSSVNPVFRMLFLYMTMKAWTNYTDKKLAKMRAAKELGHEYVDSESDKDDYITDEEEEDEFEEQNGSNGDGEGEEEDLAEIQEEGDDDDDRLIRAVIAASRRNIDDKISEEDENQMTDPNAGDSQEELVKATIDYDNNSPVKTRQAKPEVVRIETNERNAQTEEDEERKALVERDQGRFQRGDDDGPLVRVSTSQENLGVINPAELMKRLNDGDLDHSPFSRGTSKKEFAKEPSKKSSAAYIDEEKGLINYNVHNNVIINNNYYLQSPDQQEPLRSETNVMLERNISISRSNSGRGAKQLEIPDGSVSGRSGNNTPNDKQSSRKTTPNKQR